MRSYFPTSKNYIFMYTSWCCFCVFFKFKQFDEFKKQITFRKVQVKTGPFVLPTQTSAWTHNFRIVSVRQLKPCFSPNSCGRHICNPVNQYANVKNKFNVNVEFLVYPQVLQIKRWSAIWIQLSSARRRLYLNITYHSCKIFASLKVYQVCY